MMSPAVMPIAVVIAIVVFIWLQKRNGAAAGDGSVRALIRRADSDDRAQANEAIRALGRTQSDEALEYLLGRAGGATYSADGRTAAVLEALGEMSHPRGVTRLLEVVASGSVAEEHARRGLELVRGDAAVSALLRVALENDDYHAVKFAVRTLERLGTPAAADALADFRARPARTVTRRELETGRIPESTAVFG
jgi:HEAT repeat protein